MSRNIWAEITSTKPSKASLIFWFSLSLTLAALMGVLALQEAFSSPYVVQDDARQHIFWMRRFLNPDLFPNDFIADYFQSVAPWGYTTFYRIFAAVGVDPMRVAKLLPIVLGLITAVYTFALSWQLLPIPFASFLSTLMVQQVIWTHDDVASATPRAFLPPIFLAFLYYLTRRQIFPCVGAIVLQGLFYPQYVFVMAGMVLLQPFHWQQGRLRFSRSKADYGFCSLLLLAAVGVLLPYALTTSDYSPTITAAVARTLPEFNSGGRSNFFNDDSLEFWLYGDRSGIFPDFRPATLAIGVLLPLVMAFPKRFPLVRSITPQVKVLPQMAIVGLALFGVAHAVLFKLHLPSRYTAHTLRFVLALATALALTACLDAGLEWAKRQAQPRLGRRISVWGLAGILGLALLIYPSTTPDFPKTNYQQGKYPELYEFFAQQPPDSLIASLLRAADDLPSLAERSIFVGREYAIPYHLGYAQPFRERAEAAIQAHYTLRAAELNQFIQAQGIDFWLVSRSAFRPEFLEENWTEQYPSAVAMAEENLERGNPVLKRKINGCTVWEDRSIDLYVLDAQCIVK